MPLQICLFTHYTSMLLENVVQLSSSWIAFLAVFFICELNQVNLTLSSPPPPPIKLPQKEHFKLWRPRMWEPYSTLIKMVVIFLLSLKYFKSVVSRQKYLFLQVSLFKIPQYVLYWGYWPARRKNPEKMTLKALRILTILYNND